MKYLLLILTLQAHAFSSKVASPTPIDPTSGWKACKVKVLNRGIAPDWFLNEALAWAKTAPESHFEVTPNFDIYSSTVNELGPWKSPKHRRAAMVEFMRVMAGFESSWRHTVGLDTTNASSAQSKCQEEAGIFQTSQNATAFGADLKQMQKDQCATYTQRTVCLNFIACSKDSAGNLANRKFVYDFTSLLWRRTVNHHGPLKRREMHPWLSRECVAEIEAKL